MVKEMKDKEDLNDHTLTKYYQNRKLKSKFSLKLPNLTIEICRKQNGLECIFDGCRSILATFDSLKKHLFNSKSHLIDYRQLDEKLLKKNIKYTFNSNHNLKNSYNHNNLNNNNNLKNSYNHNNNNVKNSYINPINNGLDQKIHEKRKEINENDDRPIQLQIGYEPGNNTSQIIKKSKNDNNILNNNTVLRKPLNNIANTYINDNKLNPKINNIKMINNLNSNKLINKDINKINLLHNLNNNYNNNKNNSLAIMNIFEQVNCIINERVKEKEKKLKKKLVPEDIHISTWKKNIEDYEYEEDYLVTWDDSSQKMKLNEIMKEIEEKSKKVEEKSKEIQEINENNFNLASGKDLDEMDVSEIDLLIENATNSINTRKN